MPTLSQAQIAMVARSAGLPGDPEVWAAVAMAESSGRTDVVNSIGCVGLWQINQPAHVGSHPTWTVKWLQDPVNNAKAAKAVYASQGWSAWEAYTGPDGKGSDGPWKQFYKGGSAGTGSTTQAWDPFDPFGILPDGSTDPLHEAPGFKQFGDIATGVAAMAETMQKAGAWLSNSKNWLRIAYIAGGGLLVIVGTYIVAAPLVGKAAGSLPQAQAIKGVIGGGKSGGKAKAPAEKAPAKKAPAKKKEEASTDGG